MPESAGSREAFERKYNVTLDGAEPRVFWRITDNWLELTARFVVPDHGVRDIKDRMARTILREFDAAGIEVASATIELAGTPTLRLTAARDEEVRHGTGAV